MPKKLDIIHPYAAGIDIGSRSFYVDEDSIKVFPTFTADCHSLCRSLQSLGVTTVAMESTGVYWVVLYAILEEAGIEVYLVNGRDVKNVPGRKSDVKDCQWLRQLHSYGLLRKSFIAGNDIRTLRTYLPLRQDHIRSAATALHLMQKAFTQMNIGPGHQPPHWCKGFTHYPGHTCSRKEACFAGRTMCKPDTGKEKRTGDQILGRPVQP